MRPEGSIEGGAVILLVRARLLVFLDQPVFVVLDVAHADESLLEMSVHFLLVDIDAGRGFPDQGTLGLEKFQVLPGLGIHLGGVKVRGTGEVDLGPDHVEETDWVSIRMGFRFGCVDDVVGEGRHSRGERWIGTQSLKGTNTHGPGGNTWGQIRQA